MNRILLITILISGTTFCGSAETDPSTACQHLKQAELRRAKSLDNTAVRIPKCTQAGDFEPVQCSNELNDTQCWCVDEYGIEIPGSRNDSNKINCNRTETLYTCSASSCRMYCPAGFARDARSGCPICQCRDPCQGIACPSGQICQPIDVKCTTEPCPPVPSCKSPKTLGDLCPAGLPFTIKDTIRPFLCGNDPGKPTCPPLHKCLVQMGNDYGVCCPMATSDFKKPGDCPMPDDQQILTMLPAATGTVCGEPCSQDLECPQMDKCCPTTGCGMNCRRPHNITACHQAKLQSEIMAISEREGRGYIPNCERLTGKYDTKQCSRNGLVCWCVDPNTGHKIPDTMGQATMVACERYENAKERSQGRNLESSDYKCDQLICAAVCEYGFKNDHKGCPTCECSEPCEGYACPHGTRCEVAKDEKCISGSSLCASEPICKLDLVYSNPCDRGSPLISNVTGQVLYCKQASTSSREYQSRSFLDPNDDSNETKRHYIVCPADYQCTNLHKQSESVCCQNELETDIIDDDYLEDTNDHPKTMCEYLRDFADQMEGTESGMTFAIPAPTCLPNGMYTSIQCSTKRITMPIRELRQIKHEWDMSHRRIKRSNYQPAHCPLRNCIKNCDNGYVYDSHGCRTCECLPYTSKLKRDLSPAQTLPDNLNDIDSNYNGLVEVDVTDDCWCVDGFGTEIPNSKGLSNITQQTCDDLRNELECLDVTCRLGCDFGFKLDPDTRCPSCECRDPCDSVQCPDNQECRIVDVSCNGDYCPPVPACLPRKPGQCPYLVPPGTDGSSASSCEYECKSDSHCPGNRRCCSNGCGTQCVEPQFKTACQHLQTIQMHQATELGVPAKQKYIAQCDETGNWRKIQCGPGDMCWCVDNDGNELSGSRDIREKIKCDMRELSTCPLLKCSQCEFGYQIDANGCRTCSCRNPCDAISCPSGEGCHLMQVECISEPCPKMPICIPKRESVCTVGLPLKQSGREVSCGPQSDADACPSTHTCQLDVDSRKGVCCGKTRDVCFESTTPECTAAKAGKADSKLKWRFSPLSNKCVSVKATSLCQSKNMFDSEIACSSVCPVLSQCERLRLRNSITARRVGETPNLFQPSCDPETGSWNPVQCIGPANGRTAEQPKIEVCWCADKRGAPVKGTLTRNQNPTCNYRQARRKFMDDTGPVDPVLEELIGQLVRYDVLMMDNDETATQTDTTTPPVLSITERVLARFNSALQVNENDSPILVVNSTRCRTLQKSNDVRVICNEDGSFMPTQCNNDGLCWCVDEAGNQLSDSTFTLERRILCEHTPINAIEIDLYLKMVNKRSTGDYTEEIESDLTNLLGRAPDNFEILPDQNGIHVRFDLAGADKIDVAFAIEEMIKEDRLEFAGGDLRPDITLCRFVHRVYDLKPYKLSSPVDGLQVVVFIITSSSAFLVGVIVIFIMIKHGKSKMQQYQTNKMVGMGDKCLDYSSPIFVLSSNSQLDQQANNPKDKL